MLLKEDDDEDDQQQDEDDESHVVDDDDEHDNDDGLFLFSSFLFKELLFLIKTVWLSTVDYYYCTTSYFTTTFIWRALKKLPACNTVIKTVMVRILLCPCFLVQDRHIKKQCQVE